MRDKWTLITTAERDSPREEDRAAGTAAVSRIVLVTGCSSGIGKATALRLARDGWTVYAAARHADALGDLAAAGCRTMALDVTDETSCRAAIEVIERQHGAVGILVNSAGTSQSGAFHTLTRDQVRHQFETNVFGLLRLVRLVLPGMRRQRFGKIIHVSSIGGRLTLLGGGAYHATKQALEALSDALRFEVRGIGTDVAPVQPGLIRTELAKAVVASMPLDDAGPYDRFNAPVAQKSKDSYTKGSLVFLETEPDAVAKVISRATHKRRLRSRYVVTGLGRPLLVMRRLMPHRLWHLVMRGSFTRPGAGAFIAFAILGSAIPADGTI